MTVTDTIGTGQPAALHEDTRPDGNESAVNRRAAGPTSPVRDADGLASPPPASDGHPTDDRAHSDDPEVDNGLNRDVLEHDHCDTDRDVLGHDQCDEGDDAEADDDDDPDFGPGSDRSALAGADPRTMSDDELKHHLRRCGDQALGWRDGFLCALPEAARRGLHHVLGFEGPCELGTRLSGVSADVVTRVMALDARLAPFPLLYSLFNRGIVGWTKLEIVARHVTHTDERRWAAFVQRAGREDIKGYLRSTGRIVPRKSKVRTRPSSAPSDHGRLGPAASHDRSDPESAAIETRCPQRLSTSGSDAASRASATHQQERSACSNQSSADTRRDSGVDHQNLASGLDDPAVNHESPAGDPVDASVAGAATLETIQVHPLDAERLRLLRVELGRRRPGGRPLSETDALGHLLDHHSESCDSRQHYVEVVYHDPTTETRTVLTSRGEQVVTDAELARRVRDGDPIALERAHTLAKEAAAVYVAKRRAAGRPVGRHLPAAVRRFLFLRHRGFCAVEGCCTRATHIHHLKRHALDQDPDPDGLVPLCSLHGNLAHHGALEGEVPAARRNDAKGWSGNNDSSKEQQQLTMPPLPCLRVSLPTVPRTADERARARIDAKVQEHRLRAVQRRRNSFAGEAPNDPPPPAPDDSFAGEAPNDPPPKEK